jgi:hypothetical protein
VISNGHKIAGVGAVACLLGYFLPWITAGTPGFPISLNGWQATFGVNILGTEYGRHFLAILVLLAPLEVGYLIYRAFKRGGVIRKRGDAFGLIALGLMVVVIMLISSGTATAMNVNRGLGWFLCLLAGLAFGAGGFLNYRISDRSSTQPIS